MWPQSCNKQSYYPIIRARFVRTSVIYSPKLSILNYYFIKLAYFKTNKVHRTTEDQLTFSQITKPFTDTGHFHSCNHQKWLPYQILGGKTVKSVQIDPQTTDLFSEAISDG